MSRLTDLLHLSHVPRWTITPMSKPQSVAEHSFRVGVIAVEIFRRLERYTAPHTPHYFAVNSEGLVMRWAMIHDVAEAYTGDIPSPLKSKLRDRGVNIDAIDFELCPWLSFEEESMPKIVKVIVKLADSIEALSWVMAYGDGAKNLYDNTGAKIEDSLYVRIIEESRTAGVELKIPALLEMIWSVLIEIAPEKFGEHNK
jgi:5'-deoxynucleotidase YfbR-like HD superfamily hydrolase